MGRKTAWGFLALVGLACASGPDPSAYRNKTFYEYGLGREGLGRDAFEKPYPPLDIQDKSYMGVQVLEGMVRLSRPTNWVMRNASLEPEKRYIEYVSPHEILFTIFERLESPLDPWSTLQGRYEADLKAEGGRILVSEVPSATGNGILSATGNAVPVATWNAQGREYVVERGVPAPKAPFINLTREIVLRGEHRVLLVQIVHQGKGPGHITDEVLPVLKSLQVL
jgi:hypothetical protein